MDIQDVFVFIAAYLLGAIPFSVLVGKLFFKTDVRKHGSGNPGATNTLRTLGPLPALAVLLLDIGKGTAAVLLAWGCAHAPNFSPDEEMAIAGALAILGHIFSPFLLFKGGKGVATTVGVLLALHPYLAIIIVLIFTISLLISRYVSLSSILAVICYAILVIAFKHDSLIVIGFAVGLAFLVTYKHRANIQRLLNGNENKFSLGKSKA